LCSWKRINKILIKALKSKILGAFLLGGDSMADYVLSASLELKDKFTTTIRSAVDEFKKMDTDIGSATDNFRKKFKQFGLDNAKTWKDMQSSVNGFVKNATIGLVTGSSAVGAFLKSSYMGFVELNEQLTRNTAITSATEEEQEKLKKQVEELGASTKFTALEVAKAQMYQAMAGYKTNDILKVTPELLKLAIATGEDLASTSDMVTDNLSAFGLELKDVGMFIDTLANVANNTNTTVGMLGNAFTYVGSSSHAVGESFKEVATMLGMLADNGIKGEKAGTALRGLYTRLASPTREMEKQFKKVGLEIYDQNGKFKGLRKIIEESKPALMKLTEEERNQWLATVAGTEGLTAWTAVLNNSVESTKKAENAAYNATGAIDKFVETMNKTDRQKIDELSSAYDAFKRKFAEAARPIILDYVEQLTGKLTDFTQSSDLSTEKLKTLFETVEKYSKLAAGGVVAFNAAILLARALTGDPKAYVALAGLSAMGGAYAGYKVVDKYFNPEEERDKKTARDYYYKEVWERVDEGRQLHYNYDISNLNEKKGYGGSVAEEILNGYLRKIDYGPVVKKDDFITPLPSTTEQNINLNLNVDVKGLENTPNEETFKTIAKETLYESFKNINLKNEVRI
jgi:TP901 family phage tail tape measure protein